VVIEVLRAYARTALCVRIVALAEYACVGQVVQENVAQSVDAVACRPRRFVVSVQAMDCHDARAGSAVGRAIGQQGRILNRRVDALSYHLQPCAIAVIGSAEAEDAKSSGGGCLDVKWRGIKCGLREVPSHCSSSVGTSRAILSR
jgi:hypothetical protein